MNCVSDNITTNLTYSDESDKTVTKDTLLWRKLFDTRELFINCREFVSFVNTILSN